MAHVVLFMQIKNDSLQENDAEDGLLALIVKIPEVHIMFRNSKKGLSVFLASLWNCDQSVFSLRNPKRFGWHNKESCLKCRLCAKNCDRQELIWGNILRKWVRLSWNAIYFTYCSFSVESHLEFTNVFAIVIFSIENKALAKAELKTMALFV